MPEDEEMQPEEGGGKKKKLNMKSLLSTSMISMFMAFLVLYFAGPMMLSSNEKAKKEKEQQKQRIPITAVLISSGSNQTFVLKGAKDVAVIDSLVFKVGSDACRAAIADNQPLIMDALMKIFISKTKAELATPAGLELLKKQIKEAVELITGCSGNDGVLMVYLYIKAFASTE